MSFVDCWHCTVKHSLQANGFWPRLSRGEYDEMCTEKQGSTCECHKTGKREKNLRPFHLFYDKPLYVSLTGGLSQEFVVHQGCPKGVKMAFNLLDFAAVGLFIAALYLLAAILSALIRILRKFRRWLTPRGQQMHDAEQQLESCELHVCDADVEPREVPELRVDSTQAEKDPVVEESPLLEESSVVVDQSSRSSCEETLSSSSEESPSPAGSFRRSCLKAGRPDAPARLSVQMDGEEGKERCRMFSCSFVRKNGSLCRDTHRANIAWKAMPTPPSRQAKLRFHDGVTVRCIKQASVALPGGVEQEPLVDKSIVDKPLIDKPAGRRFFFGRRR